MRLLFVEDEPDLREVLKKQLQSSGYSVDACGDGLEALDYMQLTAYDAIILDIMLPGLDGLSVLQKMRTAGDKTPVLLLTARGSVEDRVAGLDLGADDYLVKPFAFDELVARLRVLLRRSSGQVSNVLRCGDLEMVTQMMYLPPNELKSIYNYQNWDYMNQLTFSSILPFKIGKWWSSRLSLSAILKHDKASHYFDAPFDRKQWTGIGIWNNTFTLSQKPDIKIELSAFGQTKGIQGSYTIKPMGKTDAAIRYTFLNQAASIQLRLNDIFNSTNGTPSTC